MMNKKNKTNGRNDKSYWYLGFFLAAAFGTGAAYFATVIDMPVVTTIGVWISGALWIIGAIGGWRADPLF